MIDSFSARHREQRDSTNADQAEIAAIRGGGAVIDAAVVDERISGEIEDLDVGLRIDGSNSERKWEQDDLAMDSVAGSTRDEIVKRASILGDSYPFVLDGSSLKYRTSKSGFYEYCLSISVAPSITSGRYTRLPRSFERFVPLIVQKHLGPKWAFYHTGAPRSKANGTTFKTAMDKLSQATSAGQEWLWSPSPGHPAVPTIGGDGGLDFVVWKPAIDSRIGQLFIVGQCACGNDWPEKYQDLRVARLAQWMRPVTIVPFISCFTTPFMLSKGNFLDAHTEAGWTLDRARLTLMAEESVADPDYARRIPTLSRLRKLACGL